MKLKSLLVFFAAAFVFASCQKEESVSVVEPQLEETTVREMPTGLLISATKTSEIPATEIADRMVDSLKIKDADLFKFTLLNEDLFNFKIVTYRILYRSHTLYRGESVPITLAGDVSFVADSTGLISKRHLESVTLFNTVFNTSQYDVTTCEDSFYTNLRAIFNALVVYPLYQGGPCSSYGEGGELIYATPTEFLIKGRQAIECELAALEFVDKHLDNVEMMPNYYTECIGISNGGGTALAIQYLLENDPAYKRYADQINLRSNYVGAGHCSNKALIENLLNVPDTSAMYSVVPAGYLACVAGAYLTWADGVNHFKPYDDEVEDGEKYGQAVKLQDYFSDTFVNYDFSKHRNYWVMWMRYFGSSIVPAYDAMNARYEDIFGGPISYYASKPLELHVNNAISLYTYSYALPNIKKTINPDLLDDPENPTSIIMSRHAVEELCDAFAENEKMLSGWNPKTPLKFVHSEDDDFVSYDANYEIWRSLSHGGLNPRVQMESKEGLSHGDSATQCIIDVVLNKHPFHAISILTYDDLSSLVGLF